MDLSARKGPRNILHLMFDPEGMRPFVANWEEVAKGLLQRVYRESVGRAIDGETKELLNALQKYPDVKTEWNIPESLGTMPVIPISFAKNGQRLNCFSMVTTVGTPRCVTTQEFRIECMYPADEETEKRICPSSYRHSENTCRYGWGPDTPMLT